MIPFPPTGQTWRISSRGGAQPLWRGDGRELFYLDLNGNIMAVDVRSTSTLQPGTPRLLFNTGLRDVNDQSEDYGVTSDGQRFLVKVPLDPAGSSRYMLILNWPALLKQ